MERMVFFGKGGIGKSTTSANLSATFAAMGMRVLHVGCDPKHDSTVGLLKGKLLEPVVDRIARVAGVTPEDIVTRSHLGVDCVEAGGPEAGVGCGGRGISRMLEIFEEAKLLAPGRYDAAVYDVLGDVVCGGFAAPLRKGIGEKVVIVTSEELMSLYAANNIAKAIAHYAENGVYLAGLLLNARDNNEDRGPVERFARMINTRVIGYVPRDPLFREAEYQRTTVVEYAPASHLARTLRELAECLLAMDAKTLPRPTPLSEADFYAMAQRRFDAPTPTGAAESAREAAAAAAVAAQPVSGGEPAPAGAVVSASRLAAAASRAAAARGASYTAEFQAGARAVRLGKVSADEAVRRLRQHFPREAASLTAKDLWA